MAKGKGKGSAFERKFSVDVSMWYSEGERDDIFYRSATSGGRSTQRAKLGKTTANSAGDICYIDGIGMPLLMFCIFELKVGYGNYSAWDILDQAKQKSNQKIRSLQKLEKFLGQVTNDAELAGVKYPMLVSKRDKRLPVITMPRELFNELTDFYGSSLQVAQEPVMLIKFKYEQSDWVSMRLAEFFDWADAEYFKYKYKELNK